MLNKSTAVTSHALSPTTWKYISKAVIPCYRYRMSSLDALNFKRLLSVCKRPSQWIGLNWLDSHSIAAENVDSKELFTLESSSRTPSAPELSMGWVDPWVGLGRFFLVFGGLSFVGSTIAKVLKILKGSIKARLDKIRLHQAVKFDSAADLTGFGNR